MEAITLKDKQEILDAAAKIPEKFTPRMTYARKVDGIFVPVGFRGHLHHLLGGQAQGDSPALHQEIAEMLFHPIRDRAVGRGARTELHPQRADAGHGAEGALLHTGELQGVRS